jgi:crotonobetainyl-CoA hydratase
VAETSEDTVLTEDHGPVRVLTLNRPRVLNAVSPQLAQELGAALAGIDPDPDIQVAIITGAGDRAFCAGADLKAMRGTGPSMGEDGAGVIARTLRFRPAKPVLAAVNGLAYGGGLELVLSCDLAVCSEQALFALPEVKRGVLATGGGLVRLPRVIGPRRALQMTLTGEPVDAATALSWGLVNSVVPAGNVLEHTMSLAHAIACNAPLSVAESKRMINEGAGLAEDDAWLLSEAAFQRIKDSADALEGPRAFAEKRPPKWQGRLADQVVPQVADVDPEVAAAG